MENNQYQLLRSRAKRDGKSMAAVIREILDKHLAGKAAQPRLDPLHHAIGIGKGDGAAVAENYEDFLYGEKR